MGKQCSVCLCKSPKMYSFNDMSPQRHLPIADMYEVITDINLSIEELAPASMCPYCVEQLENAFTFRELCIHNYCNLKKSMTEIIIEDIPQADLKIKDSVHVAEASSTKSSVQRTKDQTQQSNTSETKQPTKRRRNSRKQDADSTEHLGKLLCSVCGRVFEKRWQLNRHSLIHRTMKPYACPDCELKFRTNHALKTHQRRHTGEKPYVCSYCGHKCHSSNTLFIHVRRHTKNFPHVCNVEGCSKSFAQSSQLKVHVQRTHTGEREFQCDLCEKNYVTKAHLQQHQQRTHKLMPMEKKYVCEICENTYFTEESFTRHLERVHDVIKKDSP